MEGERERERKLRGERKREKYKEGHDDVGRTKNCKK